MEGWSCRRHFYAMREGSLKMKHNGEQRDIKKPRPSCRHWSLELSLLQEYLVFWTNKLLLWFMPVWVEFFMLCDCKHLVAWVQVSQNLTLRQGFLCTFFLGAGMQGKTREWAKQGWEEDEAKPRCDVGQSSPGITSVLFWRETYSVKLLIICL